MEDWLGATQIVNDALGRAERVTYPDGKEVGYTYGKAGERRSLTYPDGRTVSYGYDEEIRLSELKEGDAVIRYGYDGKGRLTEKIFPNGMNTGYEYDARGQLISLTHIDREGILDKYTYKYDLLGNKIEIQKQRRGFTEESGIYEYNYDPLGRLERVSKDQAVQKNYAYDAFGNRILMIDSDYKTVYTYNNMNQLLSKDDESGEEIYSYDKRGNLRQILKNGQVQQKYQYGTLNRLEQSTNQKGEITKYFYNGLGYRIGKQVREEKLPNLVKQIQYTIDYTKEYHNLLQEEENQHIRMYLWDGNVAGLVDEEKEGHQYYFQDDIGSVIRLTDAKGNVTDSYGYDEFGQDLYKNQAIVQSFGFTGYQYDRVSGNYYAQAREYEPKNGRFISEDPIRYNLNHYLYCNNNPYLFVDPSGLKNTLCGIDDVGDLAWNIIEHISNALRNTEAVKLFTHQTQSGKLDDFLKLFGFEKGEDGAYHVRQNSWQKHFGYNDLYDLGFDMATDMDKQKYSFKTNSGQEFIIWMWKGDYINLGAGGETGIYYGGGPHWNTGLQYALPQTLKVTYRRKEIVNYSPKEEQWWITGFNPQVQRARAEDIKVSGTIDFSGENNEELWNGFYKKYRKSSNFRKIFRVDKEQRKVTYQW